MDSNNFTVKEALPRCSPVVSIDPNETPEEFQRKYMQHTFPLGILEKFSEQLLTRSHLGISFCLKTTTNKLQKTNFYVLESILNMKQIHNWSKFFEETGTV